MDGTELSRIRMDNQHSRLYLSVFNPIVMGAGQLDADPSSDDKVVAVSIDNWAYQNSYTEIPADFTCYVGSAAGLYDKGMVRCRGTHGPGALTQINIGETSEINWEDNDHVTIVDEVNLWPKHLRLVSLTEIYMDYNVSFSDQHADPDPVPVLGPTFTPVYMTGATVDVTFDGTRSWSLEGSIDGYTWTAPGASATSGLATGTPTITYNAAGTYRVTCEVSCDNGKTFIGHRWVKVHTAASPPITDFVMDSCTGSWDTGGWTTRVTLHDDATQTDIRDRALVCIFTDDWYGGTKVSHGYIDDREQILMQGWVDGESIDWDLEEGTVSFDINGPQWWLQNEQGFPAGLRSTSGAATSWIEMQTLTPKKGSWQFFHWRTTMTRMLDVAIIDDSREVALFDAAGGSLWNQINDQVYAMIFSRLCADRYGRVWMGIESNLIPADERGFIPTVMAVTTADWRRPLTIDRDPVPRVALVDLSGVAYTVATPVATSLFSLAPGHIPKTHGGAIERYDRLALSDQDESNELAGLMLGWRNNEYPSVTIPFASNHRYVDVFPHMFLTITLSADDTKRGLSGTLTLIPRTVSYAYDTDSGQLLCDVTAEGDTDDTGITTLIGDPPPTVPPPGEPPPPDPDPWDPLPDTDPVWPINVYYAAFGDGGVMGGVWVTNDFTGTGVATQPTWTKLAITGSWPASHKLLSFGIDVNDPAEYVYALTNASSSNRNIIRYTATSGTWDTILSQAEIVAAHGASAVLFDFAVDKITGYLNAIVRYGAATKYIVRYRSLNPTDPTPTWTTATTSGWAMSSPGNIAVHDDVLTWCQALPNRHYLWTSTGAGAPTATRLFYTIFGNNIPSHYRNHDSNDIYHTLSSNTFMYSFQLGGSTDSAIAVCATGAQIAVWFRNEYVQQFMPSAAGGGSMRFVPNESAGSKDGHLLTTEDSFATYVDQGHLDIGLNGATPRVVTTISDVINTSDYDMILYGSHDAAAGNEHVIFAAYGNTDITPEAKSGSNPDTGVNSIHYGAGGPCWRGIQTYDA
jgi:hypothetical protein